MVKSDLGCVHSLDSHSLPRSGKQALLDDTRASLVHDSRLLDVPAHLETGLRA